MTNGTRVARASALACACLTAALYAPALWARTLHWSSLDVTANLAADGRLHVVERQAIVFDGDWNGGERRFRLLGSQRLELVAVRKIDTATGAATPLRRGSLDKVDDYELTDRTTLRWRSRRPSDPPFANATLVYEIEYRLANVLRRAGDSYVLDHDFAFPDRGGAIEGFSLVLTLDPAWIPPAGVSSPLRLTKDNMPPGTGAVVTLDLGYRGAAAPASVAPTPRVRERLSPLWLAPVALALFAFALARLRRYRAHEERNGRFAPLPDLATIDDGWLAENVFKYPPEKVGGMWDNTVGGPEVAAVLARLVQEGKLRSRIEKRGLLFKSDVLHLEMPTPHPALNAYEEALTRALFVDGDTIDTDRLRKYYEKRGKAFDPGAILRRYLRVDERPTGENRAAIVGGWKLSAVLALVALVALGTSVYAEARGGISPEFVLSAAPLVVGCLLLMLVLLVLGATLRNDVVYPRRRLSGLVSVHSIGAGALLIGAWLGSGYLGPAGLVLAAALGALALNLALNRALTRVSPEQLALRKRLTAAREYFAAQLQRPEPWLQDAWYPYLIAFGLDHEMDRWFQRHGPSGGGFVPTSGSASGGSSSHGGSTAPTWSGGGGAFGGGGASGAWTTAAGAMAAGVATSSSVGGGGGGGGGSSGGGGGGGW
jgi:uncharacterized membrane protein YgcG